MQLHIDSLTKLDLAHIAAVHVRAFPASALTGLGTEAVQRYYLWQLSGPHDAVALGAFADIQLVGFCFGGVFRGALGGFLRTNRAFLVRQVLMRPWLLSNPLFRDRLTNGLNILRRVHRQSVLPTPPATPAVRSFGILSIAVNPDIQGGGVGRRLLAEAEQQARQRGFAQMHLTVHPSNTQAIRFYERMGWEQIIGSDGWRGAMRKLLETPPVDLVIT